MSGRPRTASPVPSLHWEGKHDPRPPRVVERRDLLKFGGHGPGGLLLRADARDAASYLLDTHEGRVNLIYLDPPFLVGTDFLATTPGRGEQGGKAFAYSDRWAGPGAYLNMLHDVLVVCRRLLHDDGVIYVHVDQRVSHWVRCTMQEIFGLSRDRGVIAWHLGNGVKARRQWGCAHNDILCFSKGDRFHLRTHRPALREPFADGSMKTHFRSVDADGRRYRLRRINGRDYRYYADEGRTVGSVWTDCPSMSARSPILDQSTGYPTQKPESLLERIIDASSDTGDLVVDLFCGGGTTPAVAHRLGRRWVAADTGRLAVETTLARVLALEAPPGVEVIDLTSEGFEALERLARLLKLEADVSDAGVVQGRMGDRRVVLTRRAEQLSKTAGDWSFLVGPSGAGVADSNDSQTRVWRCHPESPSSASLRPVCFASEFELEARLQAGGRLRWSIRGQHLRQDGDGQLSESPVDRDAIASWMLLGDGCLLACGRGCPPEQVAPGVLATAVDSLLTLRVVDAYGFDGLCAVEHDRPEVHVPARRIRTSRRAP